MVLGILMSGFFLLCLLSPVLTHRSDFDDRSRRGWWVNR
jgi:hypothetical protein